MKFLLILSSLFILLGFVQKVVSLDENDAKKLEDSLNFARNQAVRERGDTINQINIYHV